MKKLIAKMLLFLGFKPWHSTNIADQHTSGYGKLGYYGDFEYPLPTVEWDLKKENI